MTHGVKILIATLKCGNNTARLTLFDLSQPAYERTTPLTFSVHRSAVYFDFPKRQPWFLSISRILFFACDILSQLPCNKKITVAYYFFFR